MPTTTASNPNRIARIIISQIRNALMATIQLDRDGNGPIPNGFMLITSEVEFLKWAISDQPLHIRGDRLCVWAQAFYTARHIPVQETPSYAKELHTLLPTLEPTQISALLTLLGNTIETLDRPLQIDSLLNTIAPQSLWHEIPSLHHYAKWLLWLDRSDELEVIKPLYMNYISQWILAELPFDSQLYDIATKVEAHQTLESWLGIKDRDRFPIKQVFPLEVPLSFQNAARLLWCDEIIQSQGNKFEEISRMSIPFSLKIIAAEETYKYFQQNQRVLSTDRIESLIPYLSGNQIELLRKILPPKEPSSLPENSGDITKWFSQDYLPYREWQRSSGSEEGKKIAVNAARQFELWYLENYPKGINGSELHHWLSFNKVNQISCPENSITLLIILDGMHFPDSRILLKSILSQTQRLSITSLGYAFAPIPTVTIFAKEALLKGVPPNLTADLEPIGKILPESHSPALRLVDAEKGKVYIWRVLEPDNTYHHKNTSENLLHDIEGRLSAEALKIRETVEKIPDDVILQIILTTDHGRLLSIVQKTIDVPEGMESHGRAAWGISQNQFNEKSYFIEDEIAYLKGESFSMLYDVALPLDEGAFKNNANHEGSELFPHGGIFPEEVILPWIELTRDLVQPEATIRLNGTGQARRDGTFNISVLNKSDITLTIEKIVLTNRLGFTITLDSGRSIPPRSTGEIDVPYTPWPSAGNLESMRATSFVRLPNQKEFEYPTEVFVQSEDFYNRPKDSTLEDLN